jgi:hypothetical protein
MSFHEIVVPEIRVEQHFGLLAKGWQLELSLTQGY